MEELLADEEEQLVARPYQTQLEEIASIKNTIIHLPTGSGKTFIAIHLIKRLRGDLKKPWGQGGKRTFFLVNTIPLVTQQKNVIKSLSPVKNVGGYSGEDGVDYWDKKKWDAELAKYEVIVMTSQILSDMLIHQYIKIEDINLLIFDECHHGVENHPMREIMKHFEYCPAEKHPRILGLTATLLNSNVTLYKVEETLRELETTFHATIATVNALGEVLNYSTNPNEVIIYYKTMLPTAAANEAKQILLELQEKIISVNLPRPRGTPDIQLQNYQHDISVDPKKIVKEVKNMVVGMVLFIDELGVYGGALGVLAYIILLERLKRKSATIEEELLYKFVITQSLMARMILLNCMKNDHGYDKIIKHSTPKLIQLLNVLKEYNPNMYNAQGVTLKFNTARKPLSGIIFTQQRFTAKVLFNVLKDVKNANPEMFGFLNHDFIVGANINPFKSTREQYFLKKNCQTALLKFSNKELNCLISTSIIEEGIDIPQCLLVLRYDPPKEYRSYIQSKGRARSSDSSFVIMVHEENKRKFGDQYKGFREVEGHIQRMLIGSTDDRDAPTDGMIQEGLYDQDEIPPYVTPNGNRLSALAAVSLLNRYCSVLPHDQFTTITPMWVQELVNQPDGVTQRRVSIYMPLACPVKEVILGLPMSNTKDAKRSAALNACVRLLQAGELHASTLLPKSYAGVNFEQPDVRQCFLNWPWDGEDDGVDAGEGVPKAGTKKRMRKHCKMFPTYLDGPTESSEGNSFYLHVIRLEAAFDMPDDSRDRALYDLLQRGETYGFLTLNPLPKICDFPMFTTVGEVKTSLEVNFANIMLDASLFSLVKRFHFFLFDQVLQVAKKFTVFDGSMNSMYAVPLRLSGEDYDIDWDVMLQHNQIPPILEPTFEERRALKFTAEEYRYHVVSPWYRGTILPDRYIVSNLIEYKTPLSLFDSSSDAYGTYADYYSNKYNLEIMGSKDQPLLEVRNICSRMNCLMPRAATINTFTDKQQKLISQMQGDDKPKGFPEVFIPEFCIKYEFPGVLWYKGMMLPSIIHRVYMLLVAHELRAEIGHAVGYGQPLLRSNQEWLPIQVNLQVAVKSMLSQIEEPPVNNTIDRINNPIDGEAPRSVHIKSLKDSLYQLQKDKINKEYTWDESKEPIDIERNISTVTVMDIECYDEFVSACMEAPVEAAAGIKSPTRVNPKASAAILPPPTIYNDKIRFLSNNLSGRGPELRDILAALTTINSHDTCNLERVETLGDSFLKFAASLYLYHKFPTLNEGQLTNIKGRLIGNRNLYYAGEKKQLGGRMKVEQFSPRKDFLVPGFFAPKEVQNFIETSHIRPTFMIGMCFSESEALSGCLTDESREMIRQRYEDSNAEREPVGGAQNAMQCYIRSQAVSDKNVADCVEAIIGTYLLDGGVLAAVKVLEWFKVLPPRDNFAAYLKKGVPTVLTLNKTTVEEVEHIMNQNREDVEEILQYKFKDPSFLLEALSHPSYIRNRVTRSYERLEFLGDAILDFLITAHIYENCGELKPGELTDLRSALVNNVTFASYVVKLGLHRYVCYQLNPVLEGAMMSFILHQEKRNHEIKEDVLYLIDEEDCHIAEYIEVPKILSDIFESLVGAMYLDSGGDLQAVWAVVYRVMQRELDAFARRVPLQPVRMLYERIHACPKFDRPQITDPNVQKVMVRVTFTKNGQQEMVYGCGSNKFQAKRAAAKLALKILEV